MDRPGTCSMVNDLTAIALQSFSEVNSTCDSQLRRLLDIRFSLYLRSIDAKRTREEVDRVVDNVTDMTEVTDITIEEMLEFARLYYSRDQIGPLIAELARLRKAEEKCNVVE